jgi:hypothetical protein
VAAVVQALEQAQQQGVNAAGAALAGSMSTMLERVKRRLAAKPQVSWYASAGDAGRLRDFAAPLRETGELGLTWSSAASPGGRWASELSVAVVADAADGQDLRLDNSHVTVQLGNWLLGANTLDRYWGPGRDSSLILSNNARPIPALVLERATATPFESRWLSWLGPWRFTALLGRMESERQDVDEPMFLGIRASIQPKPWLEVGAQRTAQFCGRGRPCSARTLVDLLLGNDNRSIDATEESEPGNQMAGIDVRIRSPWRAVPVAVYGQMIGEDESSYWPVKLLSQFGIETWHSKQPGASWRGYLEYSDTTCSSNRTTPRFGCAYRQGIFNAEGYRFRGKVIGHTADGDSEMWAAGLSLRDPRQDLWSLQLRSGDINRALVQPFHSVSVQPADYESASLRWQGERRLGRVQVQLGKERLEPAATAADSGWFGAIRWDFLVGAID